jgi:ABC-type sugar transport system ATPase subunit
MEARTMTNAMIEAMRIGKRFGTVTALEEIDLSVPKARCSVCWGTTGQENHIGEHIDDAVTA